MLWLLRHAEAADGLPDDELPLTERGTRQAEAAGLAMARLGTHIDICLSSPVSRSEWRLGSSPRWRASHSMSMN